MIQLETLSRFEMIENAYDYISIIMVFGTGFLMGWIIRSKSNKKNENT
jgi:hypothetical protein|tara:strand:+ start:90 stop:233 length:144 start_codon:yes stop_codon:yes gene_type:complete